MPEVILFSFGLYFLDQPKTFPAVKNSSRKQIGIFWKRLQQLDCHDIDKPQTDFCIQVTLLRIIFSSTELKNQRALVSFYSDSGFCYLMFSTYTEIVSSSIVF